MRIIEVIVCLNQGGGWELFGIEVPEIYGDDYQWAVNDYIEQSDLRENVVYAAPFEGGRQ